MKGGKHRLAGKGLSPRPTRARLPVMKDEAARIALRFPANERHGSALTCPEVWHQDAPILCAVRSLMGFQFLCGRDHSGDDPLSAIVVPLLDVIARDPSVEGVATINDGHVAWRPAVGVPWEPTDVTRLPPGQI
jgi:hypothetical protein